MNSKSTRRFSILALALASFLAVGCDIKESIPVPPTSSDVTPETIYSVADAMDLAQLNDESVSYTVKGKIKSYTNYYYGQLTLTDGTNDLPVYGCNMLDANGKTIYFNEMDYIPHVGDTITLTGALKLFKEAPEMGKAIIKNIEKAEHNVSTEGYTEMTVKASREAAVGTKVKLTGVVAKRTFTQKMNYNGFLLVDETGSIFIYGGFTTVQVREGNKVTVIGEIEHYIDEKETNLAAQIGYQGAIQVSKTTLVSTDKGKNEFSKAGIEDTTIKAILDTKVTEKNITGSLYHATAILNRRQGDGFVNYYINDLDNKTGSYVYTSNSGSDYSELNEFDGKVVDIYLTALNCKSTANGAVYRFVPVSVTAVENYKFDMTKAPKFVLDYIATSQFDESYAGDPEMEVITSYSSELISMFEVKITYTSSNTELAYFENKDGKTIFHINNVSDAKSVISITATYGELSETANVEVAFSDAASEASTVKQAIDAEVGTEVQVKGVVSAKTLNKSGVYIIDDTGAVVCLFNDLSGLNNGDEVVVAGTRNEVGKNGSKTQIAIDNCTLVAVVGTKKQYSTKSFTEIAFKDLMDTDFTISNTAMVYKTSAYVYKTDSKYPQIVFYESKAAMSEEGAKSLMIYSGGSGQYAFIEKAGFVGKQVTLETAIVNYNGYYKACPISLSDGTTTVVNPVK